jgi:hypothetical protein
VAMNARKGILQKWNYRTFAMSRSWRNDLEIASRIGPCSRFEGPVVCIPFEECSLLFGCRQRKSGLALLALRSVNIKYYVVYHKEWLVWMPLVSSALLDLTLGNCSGYQVLTIFLHGTNILSSLSVQPTDSGYCSSRLPFQRTLKEIDLLFAAKTPWVWDAEKNCARLKAEQPEIALRRRYKMWRRVWWAVITLRRFRESSRTTGLRKVILNE